MEMYLLTDDDAIQALADARAGGRSVQVILEPHPFGADGANQGAYDRLAAAGVDLAWASPRFALTHAKMIVADGNRALVMSLNLTHAGLTANREYAIVDTDARDVGDAAAIFAADRVAASRAGSVGARAAAGVAGQRSRATHRPLRAARAARSRSRSRSFPTARPSTRCWRRSRAA